MTDSGNNFDRNTRDSRAHEKTDNTNNVRRPKRNSLEFHSNSLAASVVDDESAESDDPRLRALQQSLIRKSLNREEVKARLSENEESQELAYARLLHNFTNVNSDPIICSEAVAIRCNRPALDYKYLSARLCQSPEINVPSSTSDPSEEVANVQAGIKAFVRHLRSSYREQLCQLENSNVEILDRIRIVFDRLNDNYEVLVASDKSATGRQLREQSALEIINLVRGAASRVLPAEYGAGIRDTDVRELEGILLEFATRMQRESKSPPGTLATDLTRLLQLLGSYNSKCVADDLAIVESGSRVVIDLVGQRHHCGLLAQLNVIVVLRDALPWNDYVDEMQRLATAAIQLRNDDETKRFGSWMRHKLTPEDRLPSPGRLASYCLGNLVFRSLDAILALEATDLSQVRTAILQVRKQDGSFEQLPWYELAVAAVTCARTEDSSEIKAVICNRGKDAIMQTISQILKHVDYQRIHEAIAMQIGFVESKRPN